MAKGVLRLLLCCADLRADQGLRKVWTLSILGQEFIAADAAAG